MSTQREILEWLENVPVQPAIADSKDIEEVRALVGNRGLALLLGVLVSTRLGLQMQLAYIPLHNSADAAKASVIQGKIQGIELIRETVLSLFPQDEGATS